MPKRNHRVMQAALRVSQDVVRLWGSGSVGPALVCAFYSSRPWRTVAELSPDVPDISEAQLRRRLEGLVRVGRAEVRPNGGQKVYRATPAMAAKELSYWRQFGETFCKMQSGLNKLESNT